MDEQDEVQLAIAALSSLKASGNGNGKGRAKQPPPSEITLPPISTMLSTNGQNANERYNGSSNGGLQYSYVHASGSGTNGAAAGAAGDSSTSTSSMTQSPTTTPSIRTATSVSSPGSPAYDRSSYTPYDSQPGDIDGDSFVSQEQGDEGFIGRVSQFPLVSGTLKLYERGKNSNRVVKYGTNLMESSVKTISQPVINRVVGPSLVGQIDNFACRQLDRFGAHSGSSPLRESPRSSETPLPDTGTERGSPSGAAREHGYFPAPEFYYRRPHGKGRAHPYDEDYDESISPSSETPTLNSELSHDTTSTYSFAMTGPPQTQIIRSSAANRSRWQNIVIEAGVTAGGIGAAVSEESMKSLKYCLHWLHYATAHLDHQVGLLREFILSLSSQHRSGALVRSEDSRAAEILNGIKRDVVETIRKVVDVVSVYAGSALPEQARRYVRSSILGLPERWTRAMQGLPTQLNIEGGAPNANGSANGEAGAQEGLGAEDQPSQMGPTQAAAERTLTFAVESLDMLSGVLSIFNDSVDRADAWVERLRIVGLQRQQALSNNHQRQTRQGNPGIPMQRRGSGPYHAIASPLSSSSSTINGNNGTTSGVKRREDGDSDAPEMNQRRKNSRTSGVRDTSGLHDGESNAAGMEVDEYE